jgi:hypothetical protein
VSSPSNELLLTLWTDDPVLAATAEAAGIDRIGPDLERLGKLARQPAGGYWLSPHRRDRVPVLRTALRTAALFVRTDPLHPGWESALDEMIDDGVDVVMLPVFRTAGDVARALSAIGDRARLVPLVETADALANASQIAALPGLTDVHFGLNDLGLALGMRNRFAVLLDPLLAHACRAFTDAGVRVGIGGIGRAGDVGLPVPADLLYAAYAGLGASAALISRSFLAGIAHDGATLAHHVTAARERFSAWRERPAQERRRAADTLRDHLEHAA